jgi:hypothetical protein
MVIFEPRMIIIFWSDNPISFEHVFLVPWSHTKPRTTQIYVLVSLIIKLNAGVEIVEEWWD